VPDAPDPTVGLPGLQGHWRKVSTDASPDRYPAEVTFEEARYSGSRGENQGMIWWDAGIYRLDDPRTLVLSTASDELVSYDVVLDDRRLVVTDADGSEVVFERTDAPPP
jgi:hypothetical protein